MNAKTLDRVECLIRSRGADGIHTRAIWNLIGRDLKDPAILRLLVKQGKIVGHKSFNRRGGTRWEAVASAPAREEVRPLDLTSQIIAYEQGELDHEAEIELFQGLINSGLVWQLQGHYGRCAARLIEAGECSPASSKEGR